MDFNEFADAVKAKHPEYADRDNRTLAEAMLKKFPEYADRVKMDEAKPADNPKFYELEKQQGLPKGPMDLVKQAGRQFVEGVTSPMPGSMLSIPIKAMSETAQQAGADVARGTQHAIGTGAARAAGFATSAALDPLSYFGGEMMKGPAVAKATPLAEMKPGVEDMIANLEKQHAPLKAEIEKGTQAVMQQVEDVTKKYGDKLNAAKKELGIPVTNKERELSIVEHGNAHGLSDKNINGMYREIIEPTKDATDLVKKVFRFKALESHISDEALKVRIAGVLQDNINNVVDWTKSGTTTEGVLKSQYKDLKQIAIPATLRASKAKMAEVLDLTQELSNKMDEPGKAEAFLRNIVMGKSARNKDYLAAIQHLEKLSGTDIFPQIEKAVRTEKATEAALKHFDKLKPAKAAAADEAGISVADILAHKITGWTSVVQNIVKFKDQIKNLAKGAAPAVGRQSLIGAAKGFALSDDNKSALNNMLQRMKGNAK